MSYSKKQKLGKWGFVNENDEPICEFIYDEVRDSLKELRQSE